MKRDKNTVPGFAMKFFRWVCDPELLEEIEGDLLEQFQKNVDRYGIKKARQIFIKEIFFLMRPATVGSLSQLIFKILPVMKKLQWLPLAMVNLVVVICIFLPFIPGRYDKLAFALSFMAQVTGFLGLLLVPFGILWLIQEIRKRVDGEWPLNNWSSGYYFAITATCICFFMSMLFALSMNFAIGPSAMVVSLLLIGFLLYKYVIPSIKKLRKPGVKRFNATPLYLLSIPMIAFTVRLFFIVPASDYSRNYAINHGEKVISAIESYYQSNGAYPESLEHIYDLPKPSVMGIDEFIYQRNGSGYNLSFVQWQHYGATREVVMFNKNDEHNVKGHFASYNAEKEHWKYYWLD